MKSETPEALRIGSIFHLAMEAMAKIHAPTGTAEREAAELEAIRLATSQYDEPRPSWLDPDQWEVERQIVYRMLFAYRWRWSQQNLAFVATEQVFHQPLRTKYGTVAMTPDKKPWMRAGVIDKIVQTEEGRLCVMEHKTSSEDVTPGSRYWDRRRMDRQLGYYMAAARDMGFDVTGVIYDVMRKPQTRPKLLTITETRAFLGLDEKKQDRVGLYAGEQSEINIDRDATGEILGVHVDEYRAEIQPMNTGVRMRETPNMYGARIFTDILAEPDKYFAREEIPITDADIDEAMQDADHYSLLINRCRETGYWPKNNDACDDWGGCEYFPLCVNHGGEQMALECGLMKALGLFPELTQREESCAANTTTTAAIEPVQAEPDDPTANTL